MLFRREVLLWLFSSIFLFATCKLPVQLPSYVQIKTSPYPNSDMQRNMGRLQNLCTYEISFQERKYKWKMLLVIHPDKRGPFWFLPHDNENAAFDAAAYAVSAYGGGFLAVESGNQRYFAGQDPNRNFGETKQTARTCAKQQYPAPRYSSVVFRIIDALKPSDLPYMALHNNSDGWYGNGGQGGVSILKSSSSVQSYPANNYITATTSGLKDEDSLIYIAGTSKKPRSSKLNKFLNLGINTRYEVINRRKNDCSMSNYVVLSKNTDHYINIETEHGDYRTQKIIIDRIMKLYQYSKISKDQTHFDLVPTLPVSFGESNTNRSRTKSNGLYVCYDRKFKVNSGSSVYWKYQGCERKSIKCSHLGKEHFGKYPNQHKAASALQRCYNSTPKFVD